MGMTRFVNRVLTVVFSLRYFNTSIKNCAGSNLSSIARMNTIFLHFVSILPNEKNKRMQTFGHIYIYVCVCVYCLFNDLIIVAIVIEVIIMFFVIVEFT
jgi:hypothetical protein